MSTIASLIIRFRALLLVLMTLASAAVSWFAWQIDIRTALVDLLPRDHAYVQVDREFRTSFGSANMVSIMLETDSGDIFRPDILTAIRSVSRSLETVPGVNPFQINSLAARKMVEVRADDRGISTEPLMWPGLPESAAEIDDLRRSVLNNPLVYGRYVSADLNAALITLDFYEGPIDHVAVFDHIQGILDAEVPEGVTSHVVGEPVLYAWVNRYLPETGTIFAATVLVTALILFLTARTLRGTVLPMLSGLASAAWALGIAHLLGFAFDPLVVVVAFLISARSVSHSVQVVARFDEDVIGQGLPPREAARNTILDLFKPGVLAVLTDAGGIAVVALTPIPLLEKVAIIGCIWVSTIIITSVFLTPILLSYVPQPRAPLLRLDVGRGLDRVLNACADLAIGPHRRWVPLVALVFFAVSMVFAFRLTIGDATPGSAILWPSSTYNQAAAAITERFRGSDRMFLVVEGDTPDAVKDPAVLRAMADLQRFMESQPEVGATVSMVDVLPSINRTIHEGNPLYQTLPSNRMAVGEMLYFFGSGLDSSDTELLYDAQFETASITAFFADRRGDTISTAIGRLKAYLEDNPFPDTVEVRLAGGVVGNTAAVNEIILADQIRSIALALLVVVGGCLLVYRDTLSGIFFMVPVLLSNTITFCFMAVADIGMNINTLPVAALGIGLGVDYSFYVVDRIKESLPRAGSLEAAIREALLTAGRAVLVTGVTLGFSVFIWTVSSLKFQAEMGLLMGVWLTVSAAGSLLLMPALVMIFRPAFIVGTAGQSGRQMDAAATPDQPLRVPGE